MTLFDSIRKLQVDEMEQAAYLIQGIATAKPGEETSTAMEMTLSILRDETSCLLGRLVDSGAPLVLTRCLARSLSSMDRWCEVAGLCELLGILFHSSSNFATGALQVVVIELFPLLLGILNLDRTFTTWTTPVQTMRLIERLSALPVKMDQLRHKEYLYDVFREAILMNCIGVGDRQSLVGIFQLTTSLVLDSDSRRQFIEDMNLFELILSNYSHLRLASYYLATFLFVSAQDVRSRASILHFPSFVEVLSSLLREDDKETKKVAITVAKLIATEKSGKTVLVSLGGSGILHSIIECAKEKVVNDSCVHLVRQLICSDTSALFHANEKMLIPVYESKDVCSESSIMVAKIIYRLSGILSSHSKGMGRYLEAILHTCSSKYHKVRYLGAKALARQSQVEACNFFLIRTPSAIDAIAKLASDGESAIRAIGMKIIGNLASNPLNHRALTKSVPLVTALTTALPIIGDSERAIKTLLTLAQNPKCNQFLAKHINLVSEISKYALSSSSNVNKELRSAALKSVVTMAPLM